jgi:hypothetical protein
LEPPACEISETAVPRSIATYERRYAFFTLAGIGEDDLSALDLSVKTRCKAKSSTGRSSRLSTTICLPPLQRTHSLT